MGKKYYASNNSSGSSSGSGGLSLATVVFVVFLILKLTNLIDWSWWWVTSPLWISSGLGISILLIYILIKIIGTRSGSKAFKVFTFTLIILSLVLIMISTII